MKSLYINDKRVLIDNNLYFPFTHKISDLEDVNVIGVPATKSISIPRCSQNDEIFGYAGNLTRINQSNTDELIGISFNQTNKTTYKIYNDSELISEGLIIIKSVTNDNYEVELYDKFIDIIEQFSDVYLNDFDLKVDNTTIDFQCNINTIKNLNYNGFKPIYCIDETELDNKSILCKSGETISKIDLPNECSPLQLRTFKASDVRYGISLNNIIDSINSYTGSTTDIVVDSSLTGLTNELFLVSNKPTNEFKPLTSSTIKVNFSNINNNNSSTSFIIDNDNNNFNFSNGNYYSNLSLTLEYSSNKTPQDYILTTYRDANGILHNYYDNVNLPLGTFIGKIFVKTTLFTTVNGVTYSLNPNMSVIELLYGVNTTFYFEGTESQDLTVETTIPINCDFYPNLTNSGNTQNTKIKVDILLSNPDVYIETTYIFGEQDTSLVYMGIGNSIIDYKPIDFKTGDYINSSTILPKISIKDFLLKFVKQFNLSLTRVGNTLVINKKNYYLTNEQLLINEIESINLSNIDFNQLVLTNKLPDNDILKNYEKVYKKKYAEQIINTGYSIKNSKKEIQLEIGLPLLRKDTNGFAYDKYTSYFNAGFSKYNYGDLVGFDSNELIIGYLNKINDFIYISNDNYVEAGFNYNNLFSNTGDTKFTNYNDLLIYTGNNTFNFNSTVSATTNTQKLLEYYTISPYKFDNNGNIIASLEINKPIINYTNINDAQYPTTSTLYYIYHRNNLIDKYDSNTHLLTIKVYIDGLIDVNKIYNYQNSYYIISKIIEYDPTIPGIYDIELMRVDNINNYINQ
jgi:hypothetical protein